MKRIKNLAILMLLVALFASVGCDSFLEPDVYSDLAPENFLNTQEGLQSLLYSAYGELMWGSGETKYRTLHASDWTTDVGWQTGGGENRSASLMVNYTWDPANNVGLMYNKPFDAIRNANTLLDNIDDADVSEELKTLYAAEARFIRAMAYYDMYGWLGPVPLRKSTEDPQEMPRATEEEMQAFIEQELLAAADSLPLVAPVYGRATSGAARGVLTKFYLNTKQWQKAADMAQTVMGMGYSLYPDYFELFQVENEQNSEFIWVDTAVPDGPGNAHMNGTFPPGFRFHPRTGLEWQSNWNNWASQYRLRDNFFESFEEGDERMELIVREYVNAAGDTVSLRGADNTRAFKYWPDPNAIGNQHGNDLPRVRYADILLSRAEALARVQGGVPQESVDLLNEVRERADLDPVTTGDFGSQEAFLDHLLQERAWEFYAEGLRREDLIRHGKLIEGVITLMDGTTIPVGAQNRGINNAQDCHVRFPIARNAMDANPALEQNECYR